METKLLSLLVFCRADAGRRGSTRNDAGHKYVLACVDDFLRTFSQHEAAALIPSWDGYFFS